MVFWVVKVGPVYTLSRQGLNACEAFATRRLAVVRPTWYPSETARTGRLRALAAVVLLLTVAEVAVSSIFTGKLWSSDTGMDWL